jgi:hypothetical protein
MGHNGLALRPRCIGAVRFRTLDILVLTAALSGYDEGCKAYHATKLPRLAVRTRFDVGSERVKV